MRQCRELVELSRKENLAGKAEFAYKRMFYGHGEAMDDLRRLWEGNRSDATILRYALNGLAIRRGICRPFQTGESKLFDDVSSSGLWRDPKKVKASVRQ